MNVALVSNPGDVSSGTGKYADRLCEALRSHVDVKRVTLPSDEWSPLPFIRAALGAPTGDTTTVHVQFDYVVFGPLGIYTLLFFPMLAVGCRLRGVPVVVTVHEALNANHVSSPLAWLKRAYVWVLNLTVAGVSDHLVFLSEQTAARFRDSVVIDASTVLPHGVDTTPPVDATQTEAKREFGFEPDDVLVVEPGYVSPRKGTDVFVSLAEQCPDLAFLVAGGPPRERHRSFGESLRDRAATNVSFTGALSERSFHVAFVAADAILLPYREVNQTGVVNPVNQSGVFNLCAAHEVPVAGSDCSRFRAVEERWGCPRLFDPDDINDVEATLRSILEDKEADRLRKALSAYAVANSFERVAEAHITVYEEVGT